MDSNESSNEKTEFQLESERNPEMDKLAERKISGQQLEKSISPAIKNMTSIIQKNQASMLGLLQTNMNYALEPLKNSVLGRMQELLDVWKQAFAVKYDFSELAESARRMSEIISESVQRIRIPALSEERKQELIEAHKLWGSYGWTMNPCENAKKIFEHMPSDKKSADIIALKQCSGQKMEQIFEIIQELNRGGATILLVEQNAQMALSVADRGYVLETGRITLSGLGKDLLADQAVKKAYLGG